MGLQQMLLGQASSLPIVEVAGMRVSVAEAAAVTAHPITWPSVPVAGQLLIVCIAGLNIAITGQPAGWSLMVAGNNHCAVYAKVADGTDPQTITFTTTPAFRCALQGLAYTGLTLPRDAIAGNNGVSAAATTTALGVLAVPNELVITVWVVNGNVVTFTAFDNGQTLVSQQGVQLLRMAVAANVVASAVSVDYGATLSASGTWEAIVCSFRGP
jgi:hypothetical protein